MARVGWPRSKRRLLIFLTPSFCLKEPSAAKPQPSYFSIQSTSRQGRNGREVFVLHCDRCGLCVRKFALGDFLAEQTRIIDRVFQIIALTKNQSIQVRKMWAKKLPDHS